MDASTNDATLSKRCRAASGEIRQLQALSELGALSVMTEVLSLALNARPLLSSILAYGSGRNGLEELANTRLHNLPQTVTYQKREDFDYQC